MSFLEDNNLILVDKKLKIYRYVTQAMGIFRFVLEDETEITEEYVYHNEGNEVIKSIRKYIEKFKSDNIEAINQGLWLHIESFNLHRGVNEKGFFI